MAEQREKSGQKIDPSKNFNKGRVLGKIAEKLNTSHITLHKAKVIQQEKPELFAEIDEGRRSLHSVYNQILKKNRLQNARIIKLNRYQKGSIGR